mmetsp:Transcript_22215/g.54658  ORF Transcript_22215/g.54658 Transcript_22215/m.54658 type:complete len:208 (+) Transcript_22215:79-702(+)
MTWRGETIADSAFCIERLTKDLGVRLDEGLSLEQQAAAYAIRKMVEESTYWTVAYARWVEHFGVCRKQVLLESSVFMGGDLPYSVWRPLHGLLMRMAQPAIKKALHAQGFGRFDRQERQHIIEQDLLALANYLGGKPFMMGDKPTTVDACVFGELALCVWQLPGSHHEHLLTKDKRFEALYHYTLRLKNLLFPECWPRPPKTYDPPT